MTVVPPFFSDVYVVSVRQMTPLPLYDIPPLIFLYYNEIPLHQFKTRETSSSAYAEGYIGCNLVWHPLEFPIWKLLFPRIFNPPPLSFYIIKMIHKSGLDHIPKIVKKFMST